MAEVSAILTLLRPQQWFKNIFVLAGIVFSPLTWSTGLCYSALAATLLFCGLASSVYIYNDIVDRTRDRLHSEKKLRPLAAGTITPRTAWLLFIATSLSSLSASLFISRELAWISISYWLLNIAYTLYLKHIFLIDVGCIAGGFMLRLLAGTMGLQIAPSRWLIICTLLLALFLGFAKRYAELTQNNAAGITTRGVLRYYTPELLRQLMCGTAVGTLVSYSCYIFTLCILHKMRPLTFAFTAIPVSYGIWRYYYLMLHCQVQYAHDIVLVIYRDQPLLISLLCWGFLIGVTR